MVTVPRARRRGHGRRPLAAVALCAVIAAGCGLRVPSRGDTALQAGAPAAGADDGTSVEAGSVVDGSSSAAPGALGGDSVAETPTQAGPGAATPAPADAGAGTPASGAGPTGGDATGGLGASGGCTSGGPSGDGVTADTVTVGAIAGLGGPADSTLIPYKIGYDAGINEVNAQGGVCGRKLEVIWVNTGGSADKYGQAARDLIENKRVFALTAVELAHQGGADYIASKRVPVVGGESASNVWFQNPMYFPIGNQYNGTAMMGHWAAKQKRLTKAAVLSVALAVSQEGCAVTVKQLKSLGVPVVYEASVPVGSPDMSSYVQQARSAGADGILQCFDVGTGVSLMKALQQQRWKPYVGAVSGSADTLLLSAASPDVLEGMEVNFPTPAWVDPEPIMQRYKAAVESVQGKSGRYSSFGVRGYAAAMLLKAALQSAGPKPTREAVINWLNKQDKFTLGGLLPPDTTFVPGPNGFHRESNCSRQYAVRGGQFVNVSNGWTCLDTN